MKILTKILITIVIICGLILIGAKMLTPQMVADNSMRLFQKTYKNTLSTASEQVSTETKADLQKAIQNKERDFDFELVNEYTDEDGTYHVVFNITTYPLYDKYQNLGLMGNASEEQALSAITELQNMSEKTKTTEIDLTLNKKIFWSMEQLSNNSDFMNAVTNNLYQYEVQLNRM